MPEKDLTLPDDIQDVVERALAEDIGDGDRNAALVDETLQASARVVVRENAILSGAPWFERSFKALDERVQIEWLSNDGERIRSNTTVCEIRGPVRALLTGERTALNFLQLLSGVATSTFEFVERVKGTNTQIIDTRKTLPGLRSAQRYAVRCGGGMNHRFGLFDAILIKENHIMAAGSIETAVSRARDSAAGQFVQVEIETLEELEQALEAGCDGVLLDNLASHVLARAVNMADAHRRRFRRDIVIEASGDINLRNVREIADTGVDRISIGGLTKHLRATDFSMRMHTD
ncbi:Nicotinate-nucleotide pyrophosphorylase carboxylating protein [Salinisphaera shabanensis E1L3A]|uniref:Nicotinate-nucleotide pyrophosphorylase carboxylating protein n=1 Tax=Salinisphaera shabanensis E1L3A TaxID=1033802 RepID=A0ACB4V5Q0_9GAMM|nr:carboxylating nicotinate-nucleotide diphosphorylase [Salinisphaera shabanensis]ERJ18948.1 Nicotinate-nucleotide pyrophosphorylase carboxylating protein [Salinisphaera shabanensis E1L3A]